MAEPVSSALVMVAKKLAVDLLTDPGKVVKFLLYGVIIPLLSIVLVLIIPIIIIVSLPVLLFSYLFGGGDDPATFQAQLDTIAFYQNAPISINKSTLEWIDDKKNEYNWCDDIQVKHNYNLTWQDIMAIDTVLLKQDFSGVTNDHVIDIGNKYLVKSSYTEDYQAEVKYEVEEEYEIEEPYFDKDTRTMKTRTVTSTRTVTKTKTVTKTRGVISISTKSFDDVVNNFDFTSEEINIAKNIYKTILNYDIEGQLNIYDDIDLSNLKEYPPGSSNLPYFNQTDLRWGASNYGKTGTIASAGCGPTALAMVVSGLTGRGDINPKSVADWSFANGHRAEGNGSYWSLMTDGASNYGLTVKAVSRQNPKKIIEALSNGYPVIASMGRGHFTKGGHFIVLRGITDDGKILVHDPASVSRSEKEWDIGIIMNESSINGGVNGSPFWIYQ